MKPQVTPGLSGNGSIVGAGSKRAATKSVLDKDSVGSILEHTELIWELFQVTVPTVNEHLKGIYDEGELDASATIRKFRIVRTVRRESCNHTSQHPEAVEL